MRIRRLPIWIAGRHPRRTLMRAVVLGIIAYLVFGFALRVVRVRGASMEPTLHNGSLHVANLLRYRLRAPARGDVVLIAMAGHQTYFVKRVVGLPGERVAFDTGRLLIDGATLAEPYLPFPGDWTMPALTVGTDQFFVAGDNRTIPMENHVVGLVDRRSVAGGLCF